MIDEIECPDCCGNGQTFNRETGDDDICPYCKGMGWRAPKDGEIEFTACNPETDK